MLPNGLKQPVRVYKKKYEQAQVKVSFLQPERREYYCIRAALPAVVLWWRKCVLQTNQMRQQSFFYNPNIHPRKEYEIRKEENKRFCEKLGIPFVDCDYDADNWYSRMKGLEFDPERGQRCTQCFDMRMERTALYAHENGYDTIATTNATSRWKDAKQVDGSGFKAAERYEGLKYWAYDWQNDEMTMRKYQVS